MSDPIKLHTPLMSEDTARLHAGEKVLLSGIVYAARDAAHKRMIDLIREGKPLPVELDGQVIYYVGPTPAKPEKIIGSAGPTTSGRMDTYTPALLERGLKGMIGKGPRSMEVREAMKHHKAVYFGATGGAAALLARTIKKAEIVAYEDLGAEAIRKLEVADIPLIVINDIYGYDLYEQGVRLFSRI